MATLVDKLLKEAKPSSESRTKKVAINLTISESDVLDEYSKLIGKSKQDLILLACNEAGLFTPIKKSE